MKVFLNKVTLPYVVYLMYFLGVGFLSGAIVHYPVNKPLYGAIGIVGAVIFTIASTLNEWITNKRHLLQEGIIKIVFYSLILSIGLGMISGGIQHFVDFPVYASYLIPIGFVVSLVGFVLNREIKLDTQHKLILVAKLSLIAIPLFLILNTWAKTMDPSTESHGHSDSVTNSKESNTEVSESVNHAVVKNDEEFIFEMIPHHQEAIETSKHLDGKIDSEELRRFANDVIDVQTIEVTQMKKWYRLWFGKDYETNTHYMSMMGDLKKIKGKELEKEYVKGMIIHHNGAIAMAKQIQLTTEKSEIKKLAEEIINVQTEEITLLQNLLEDYDHEESEHMMR